MNFVKCVICIVLKYVQFLSLHCTLRSFLISLTDYLVIRLMYVKGHNSSLCSVESDMITVKLICEEVNMLNHGKIIGGSSYQNGLKSGFAHKETSIVNMLENMLKWRTDSDINLTIVCRHRWSRQMTMKVDKYLKLSARTVVFIS